MSCLQAIRKFLAMHGYSTDSLRHFTNVRVSAQFMCRLFSRRVISLRSSVVIDVHVFGETLVTLLWFLMCRSRLSSTESFPVVVFYRPKYMQGEILFFFPLSFFKTFGCSVKLNRLINVRRVSSQGYFSFSEHAKIWSVKRSVLDNNDRHYYVVPL